jgi:hypothetical protein
MHNSPGKSTEGQVLALFYVPTLQEIIEKEMSWPRTIKLLINCVLLSSYAASSGYFLPTFRDNP